MPRLRDRKPVDYTDYLSPTPLKKSYPTHPRAPENEDVGELKRNPITHVNKKSKSKKRPREQSEDSIRVAVKSKSSQSIPVGDVKQEKKRKKKNIEIGNSNHTTGKEMNGVAAKKKMRSQQSTQESMIGRKREKKKVKEDIIRTERLLNGRGALVPSHPSNTLRDINESDVAESVESLRQKYQALKKV